MKNAIFFFLFNLFLITIYFYSNFSLKAVIPQKINTSTPEQKVTNFTYSVISKGNIFNIKGRNLIKDLDGTYIEELDGIYREKNQEVSFSSRRAIYKDETTFVLQEEAQIFFDKSHIKSNELIYDLLNNKIFSKGKTIIFTDNIKIEGLNFEYDLNKSRLKAEKIRGLL